MSMSKATLSKAAIACITDEIRGYVSHTGCPTCCDPANDGTDYCSHPDSHDECRKLSPMTRKRVLGLLINLQHCDHNCAPKLVNTIASFLRTMERKYAEQKNGLCRQHYGSTCEEECIARNAMISDAYNKCVANLCAEIGSLLVVRDGKFNGGRSRL